jgi:hypothetical protein
VSGGLLVSPIVSVLGRIEVGLADLPVVAEEERWHRRFADEAALLIALLEGFFDCAAPENPENGTLVAHLRAMMARGVPPRPVQRFLLAAAEAAFAELWHRAGPGDAGAVLRVSRLIEGRRSAAERLLHHHVIPPAPRSMEVV